VSTNVTVPVATGTPEAEMEADRENTEPPGPLGGVVDNCVTVGVCAEQLTAIKTQDHIKVEANNEWLRECESDLIKAVLKEIGKVYLGRC
jgi:hypothetical protein